MFVRRLVAFSIALLASPTALAAQETGGARKHALVQGLTVTPRVLLIGAEPGDADADLIARPRGERSSAGGTGFERTIQWAQEGQPLYHKPCNSTSTS